MDFEASLDSDAPPSGFSLPLQALWHLRKGDWNAAHACAQADESPAGSLVHAHLHRVEGDLSNAAYWYRRAGEPVRKDSLDAEAKALIVRFSTKSMN